MKIYQIDAFTDKIFSGNPAAVCPLDDWISEDVMQKIARENNLPETAFYVKKDDSYEIRWFTPILEVDLCGHATLATAYVLYNYEGHKGNSITFFSPRSGKLIVTKNEDLLTMDFPTDSLDKVELTPELEEGFNLRPIAAFKGKTDYLLVFNSEEDIRSLLPKFEAISKLDCRGVIVSAIGNEADFVSRFFAPQSGVNEDPVTGSAHTTLIPYWANKTSRNEFSAVQLSKRKGTLQCKYLKDRVEISGQCKTYLIGEINLHS